MSPTSFRRRRVGVAVLGDGGRGRPGAPDGKVNETSRRSGERWRRPEKRW